jgi:FlaA1/EpsC-like NDP-sugar epimerase
MAGHSVRRDPVAYVASGLRLYGPSWLGEVAGLNAAFALAFLFRYGGHIPGHYSRRTLLAAAVLVTLSYTAADLGLRAYRRVWRFASVRDMVSLAATVATSVVVVGGVELTVPAMAADRPIPLSALLIGGALAYLALSYIKLLPRLLSTYRRREGDPLVVVGAGAAGVALVRQLQTEPGGYRPVAFIDDDLDKIGRRIAGLPVVGARDNIPAAVDRYRAGAVAIAMPSAPQTTVRALIAIADQSSARILVVPSIHEMITTGRGLPLREIGLEDLFGRPEVAVDVDQIRAAFAGRRVLVTGAAGSIGSEICRQVAALDPAALVLLDNNESGLADIRDELAGAVPCELALGSIADPEFVEAVFAGLRPEVVLHAAAYKHVDILEQQPAQAARTNVAGTWHCARAAERCGAGLFVFISSDKAVEATGVLGASKRIGERMVMSLSGSPTRFCAVRFGNVLGSRGSVVPVFERQIAAGGPITITHTEVRRYFMSIAEAVRLVLQSAAVSSPGRVYVLDMGEDVSILSLAQRLCRLRGLRMPEDIGIVVTGLRPGERLREELVAADEVVTATAHPKVREMLGGSGQRPQAWERAVGRLLELTDRGDPDAVRAGLLRLSRQGAEDLTPVASLPA